MAPKKRRKYPKHNVQNSEVFQQEIEALFNKKFVLKSSEDISWARLPDASGMFTEPPFVLEDLISMKDDLNRNKSLLDDMDIDEWHLHTRRAHKAGLVVKHLRDNLRVEMCTQAWAKFHEILHTFDLVPEDAQHTGKFRSVHLCEAPGAFVACLNHLLKSSYHGLQWEWLANTLNPYYEGHDLKAMLDDDRFIFETLPHWHFGADGTGDLMKLVNLEALQKDMDQVHLVTADGSINCANQPDEQESVVAQLCFCEAVTAINLLSQGGNFVFKMFTAFEHQMICLLYLFTCLFQEVHVLKPGTSKSGNSEVYIVCLHFTGREEIPADIMQKLREGFGACSPQMSLFPLTSIPSFFLERLKVCEKYFTGLQMEAIDQNIKQFHHMSARARKSHTKLRQLVVEAFVERFLLQPINREDRIVPGFNLDGTQLSFTRGPSNDVPVNEIFNGRHQIGSYNQRQRTLDQDWFENIQSDELFKLHPSQYQKLEGLSQTSNGVTLIPLYPDQVVWLPKALYTTPKDITETWKTQAAACVGVVLNSRFCTPLYISKLREARQRATILKKENLENLERILNRGDPSHVVSMSTGGEAEVKNLDNIISFTETSKNGNCGILLNVGCSLDYVKHHLEERNANFSSIHIHISAESGRVSLNQETGCQVEEISQNVKRILQIDNSQNINLVFADVDNSDELNSRRNFLCLCITALKLLKSGGMFVCRLCETMTRFTVGILYILHQLFDKLAFVKPFLSQLSSPQRFLVCKGYNSTNVHFPAYLVKVLDQIVKLDHEQSALDVVEVVPMGLLYSEPFYSFVKKTNEQLSHLELQNIVHLESIYLCPDKGLSSEEISKLREEIMEYLEK